MCDGLRGRSDESGEAVESLHDAERVGGPRIDVPGLRFFRGEPDQRKFGFAELAGSVEQPGHELTCVENSDRSRDIHSPVLDRSRVEHRENGSHGDGESRFRRQATGDVATVADGVP